MYCSDTCQGLARSLNSGFNLPLKAEAFCQWFSWSDGCWEWQGAKDRDGYGAFSYAGKTRKAHRVALELSGIEIPVGYYACHKCNNPSCVNPSHLYAGTPKQNCKDKIAANTQQNGEGVHCSKLTENAVKEIRRGGLSDKRFAKKYGVSRSAVTQARIGTTWKHVRLS